MYGVGAINLSVDRTLLQKFLHRRRNNASLCTRNLAEVVRPQSNGKMKMSRTFDMLAWTSKLHLMPIQRTTRIPTKVVALICGTPSRCSGKGFSRNAWSWTHKLGRLLSLLLQSRIFLSRSVKNIEHLKKKPKSATRHWLQSSSFSFFCKSGGRTNC